MQTRDFIYDDLNRELVNHFPNAVADNYEQFVDFMLRAIQEALNTDAGQELIDPIRQHAIDTNMPQDAWRQVKVKIMLTLFCMMLDELPMLKHELAHHLYHELRREN